MEEMLIHRQRINSPFGMLTLYAGETGVLLVALPEADLQEQETRILKAVPAGKIEDGVGVLQEAETEFAEYFSGSRQRFTLPLDLRLARGVGLEVCEALDSIPYGETRTYGEVAAMIHRPQAVRAVGSACGANPLPLLLPCHRVVASSGLGGYGGGLPMKRWLLRLEDALKDHSAPTEE